MARSHPSQFTPLHYTAGSRKASADVVRLLISVDGDAVTRRSSFSAGNRTPLHVACAARAPFRVVKMLHDAADNETRNSRDSNGSTPWDLASVHSRLWNPLWRWRIKSLLDSSAVEGLVESEKQPIVLSPVSEDAEESADADGLCVLCWDREADHVLVPCGHLCLCRNCSRREVLSGGLKGECPVCKSKIDQAVKVFRAGVPNPG